MNKIQQTLRQIARKFGYDVVRHPTAEVAFHLNYGINKIFDVGANTGQYALRQIGFGYTGKIVSFEPVSSTFIDLKRNAHNYSMWEVLNYGLGNADGENIINVSESSVFSSMLKSTPFLNQMYPDSKYIYQEKIQVHKLDSIFNKYYQKEDKVFLKIDTQGSEKNILKGAENSLKYISGLQVEVSFKEHYQGEILVIDMINFLFDEGFTLVALSPLYHNLKSGDIAQADGIFWRLD
ncbi:MAG: FkbM family methyltransferase [Crinalium sp.]